MQAREGLDLLPDLRRGVEEHPALAVELVRSDVDFTHARIERCIDAHMAVLGARRFRHRGECWNAKHRQTGTEGETLSDAAGNAQAGE